MLGYVNLNQLFVSVDLVKATFRVNVNIMQTCLTDAFMNEIKNILLGLERSSGYQRENRIIWIHGMIQNTDDKNKGFQTHGVFIEH